MGLRQGTRVTPEQQAAHQRAEDQGLDGYFDPETGLLVMTASSLLRRERCCRSGCRHCPFRLD
jgi:hypothetical protein